MIVKSLKRRRIELMSEDDKKPNKKTRVTRAKKVTKKKEDSEESVVSDKETEYIAGLIKSSIEQAKIRRTFKKKDMERLSSMIEEFLSCYVVIGYDFHGEPVNLLSVESQQQADSLGTAMTRFMAQSPRPGPPPMDDYM